MNPQLRETMLAHMNGDGSHLNGVAVNPKPNRRTTSERKRPGWWAILCLFIDERLKAVSPLAGCVWFILFRNSHDSIARLTHDQIAVAVGMSQRSIRYAIAELVEADLVRIESKGGRNIGPTRYRILSTGNPLPPDEDSSCGNPLPTACGNPLPTLHEKAPTAALASSACAIGGER